MFLLKARLNNGRIKFLLRNTNRDYWIIKDHKTLQDIISTWTPTCDEANIHSLYELEIISANNIQEILPPIDNQEVWASGLTYELNEFQIKSLRDNKPEYYKALIADLPILFFKSIGNKVEGNNGNLGLLNTSIRIIPEAEVVLLINKNKNIVAFSSGNDVTATSIESITPLFQPQAKYFNGSCAIGPEWRLNTFESFPDLKIKCSVYRNSNKITEYSYTTADLNMEPTMLVDYLFRNRNFENGVLLFLGSNGGVSPNYMAQSGDRVVINNSHIDDLIGTFS